MRPELLYILEPRILYALVVLFVAISLLSPVLLGYFAYRLWCMNRQFADIKRQFTTVTPYWQAIQAHAIDKLTHPHLGAERADELLTLLKANPLHPMTEADRAELQRRMVAVANGEDPRITGEEEKDLARIFPVVMKKVQEEAADPSPIEKVQLVGIKKST